MRTFLIITFFTVFMHSAQSQNLTIEQVDRSTYESYMNKDYDNTIKLGNEALKQGIDFYFLRYRIGVSYYEKKNYEAAISHLEKAKSFQSDDPILMEYLYYAYVFSNHEAKAALLAETFSPELKDKIKYNPKIFKSVEVEAGVLFTNNYDKFKNADLKGTNNLGRGTFYSDVLFGNVLIENQFSPKFKLKNNFSYVSNTSNDIIQLALPAPTTRIYTNKNNYFQWNAIGSYFINDFTISIGAGLYNSSSVIYTVLPPNNPQGQPVSSSTISSSNYSGSISVSKRFKYLAPSLSFSYTNLLDINTLTTEGSLTYYPFGNLNFYGNSKLAYVTNSFDKNSIFTQLLGVKLTKKIWLEGFGAIGNHQNYISENGLFTFNTPDQINWYVGSNLNIYLNRFEIGLGYGIQERESYYSNGFIPTNLNTINYTYTYNSIKTKIVWKF